jgi:hypothetical protein
MSLIKYNFGPPFYKTRNYGPCMLFHVTLIPYFTKGELNILLRRKYYFRHFFVLVSIFFLLQINL